MLLCSALKIDESCLNFVTHNYCFSELLMQTTKQKKSVHNETIIFPTMLLQVSSVTTGQCEIADFQTISNLCCNFKQMTLGRYARCYLAS